MTDVDKEIQAAFAEEVKGISAHLTVLAEKIRINYTTQPELFEQFGKAIDGIYGVAVTLGYIEISDYCRSIKNLTYKCAKIDNLYVRGQVKDIVVAAAKLVNVMHAVIAEPEQLKKIQYLMQREREKAEDLLRK